MFTKIYNAMKTKRHILESEIHKQEAVMLRQTAMEVALL